MTATLLRSVGGELLVREVVSLNPTRTRAQMNVNE